MEERENLYGAIWSSLSSIIDIFPTYIQKLGMALTNTSQELSQFLNKTLFFKKLAKFSFLFI